MADDNEELLEELRNARAKVQYLIDYMDNNGMLLDHCFTFPDGDTDWATGKGPQ